MLTGVAEGYGHICGGPFPHDFHKVPYSPLLALCVGIRWILLIADQ